ncbi:MAG: elongation factor G [Spirochaetia bacterium]|jgi:elongation factor G|nr:elongation factor G [Spirochaetia bacterium]
MSFTTADIRNISLVGHGSTGKTSLLEQMLYVGGVIPKAELPDTGKSVSDHADEEIERKISIHTTLAGLEWHDKQFNILDTPGIADFVGEVVSAYRATESSIVLIDGSDGVQIETIKLWRRLNNRKMPRMVFINKLDKDRANFDTVFDDLNEKFDKTFVPVTIPIGNGKDYKGIVNLIENKAYLVHDSGEVDHAVDIPDDIHDMVEEYRLKLIESAAEGDDKLIEKYFEEGTLSPVDIRLGLKEGLQSYKIVPVLCGSSLKNNGVTSLLNFISNIAPSPACYTEVAVGSENQDIDIAISIEEKFSSFVFKTSMDQFSGKLSFIKVVSGILNSDTEIYNSREEKKEKNSKIFKAIGKKLIEVRELPAGDIGILVKLDTIKTNDTICSSENFIHFKQLGLPHPIYAIAVSATSKKEEDKLNDFLHRVSEEDLTFQMEFNKETKENVISGMGELHLTIILNKIINKQKIEVQKRVPKIAYREAITKSADAEYAHKKQSGGHGQYGKVLMSIKPISRGSHFEFINAIKGGSISKGYMPGIEKGIIEAMAEGFLAGYPIDDVQATITDGKEHPVDSSEMAFKLAGKGAMKVALEKAGVKLLEPVMKLKVFVTANYIGDILSDLSSKRARVLGQEDLGGGILEVDAEVPQAELQRYSIDIKSLTSGTGSFEMEFDHYSTISGKIADDVIKQSLKTEE